MPPSKATGVLGRGTEERGCRGGGGTPLAVPPLPPQRHRACCRGARCSRRWSRGSSGNKPGISAAGPVLLSQPPKEEQPWGPMGGNQLEPPPPRSSELPGGLTWPDFHPPRLLIGSAHRLPGMALRAPSCTSSSDRSPKRAGLWRVPLRTPLADRCPGFSLAQASLASAVPPPAQLCPISSGEIEAKRCSSEQGKKGASGLKSLPGSQLRRRNAAE